MSTEKKVLRVLRSQPTTEGAGVKLRRAFGFHQLPHMDPFLLLDHFGSSNPDDFMPGFPWHPHRGIETVTYMIEGMVDHGDSLGNSGTIGPGDIQWMTAGSGIIHQEMPKAVSPMLGFQLWVNLPKANKLMEPRYRDITSDIIPRVNHPGGASINVISGSIEGVVGPVKDLMVDIEYLDVYLPPNTVLEKATKNNLISFAYVFQGKGYFESVKEKTIGPEHLILFDRGDSIYMATGEDPVRFLLISGPPLQEPIAWRGPIVMNTNEELDLAFKEFHQGNFIKHR